MYKCRTLNILLERQHYRIMFVDGRLDWRGLRAQMYRYMFRGKKYDLAERYIADQFIAIIDVADRPPEDPNLRADRKEKKSLRLGL